MLESHVIPHGVMVTYEYIYAIMNLLINVLPHAFCPYMVHIHNCVYAIHCTYHALVSNTNELITSALQQAYTKWLPLTVVQHIIIISKCIAAHVQLLLYVI